MICSPPGKIFWGKVFKIVLMADDKKKNDTNLFTKNHYKETSAMLLVLLFIGTAAQQLYSYVTSASGMGLSFFWQKIVSAFFVFWSYWKITAVILSALGIFWIVYNTVKRKKIIEEEDAVFSVVPEGELSTAVLMEEKGNEKWLRVVERVNSINPSDWRLAIIEADVMLDELLIANGYDGEGVGERLKQVEPSDMLTLDAAWEAHKVRNRIAHSGADFELNEREAKRVVALFESVFKEYEII